MNYFIGVDVGTGSARAALVSDKGKVINIAVKPLSVWNDGVYYEQSSDEIWSACVFCIKEVVKNVSPAAIKGIGFDATCSLVTIDSNGKPLCISHSGDDNRNIIMWLDHRADKEATKITNMGHDVLKFVGGKISLEMETPKLLWLKQNMPGQWSQAGRFFDLPDYLTWKATNCDSRSLCSLVCKWAYEICEDGTMGWNKTYLAELGLADLLENDAIKIGKCVNSPGTPVGKGLSDEAAHSLGLMPGTPVATSIIDAHSGGLGVIGCAAEDVNADFHTRLSLICGTSTCHMAVSKSPIFTPGIWGPYYSAMVPDMWLNEGGQSVTGKLIDFIIDNHPATVKIKAKINTGSHVVYYLNNLLEEIANEKGCKVDVLTKDIHVYPDFHGNRSPVADPNLKGSICGLTLTDDEENLALMYLATVQALCYGTRHIIDVLRESGYKSIESILICGGLSKNALFLQRQADVANLPVVCPEEVESVLLGSAILGAYASGYYTSISEAIRSMGGKGSVVKPNESIRSYHDKKYTVFLKMLEHQQLYKSIMNDKI